MIMTIPQGVHFVHFASILGALEMFSYEVQHN